jgi:hypothetical protein
VFSVSDTNYDSATIYIDNQDRIFVAARYYVSSGEDQIRLFTSTNGTNFNGPLTIFSEANVIVDPAYLILKGDSDNNLFLVFPYRPGANGAYVAIIAGNPGGTLWTEACTIADPINQHPAMAVRPDGSIEVAWALHYYVDPSIGSTDTSNYSRNYIYGRSHPGFIE